jgi:hypothetical protein
VSAASLSQAPVPRVTTGILQARLALARHCLILGATHVALMLCAAVLVAFAGGSSLFRGLTMTQRPLKEDNEAAFFTLLQRAAAYLIAHSALGRR